MILGQKEALYDICYYYQLTETQPQSFVLEQGQQAREIQPDRQVATEVDTDWMHPWIGLDWIGLQRMDDVILCYRWIKQAK